MITDTRVTAAEVLCGSGGRDAATELTDLIGRADLTRSSLRGGRVLTSATHAAVDREIASALAGFLEIDLGDVLLGGWSRYLTLRNAAVRTRTGGREVVPLARHRIVTTHRPWIDLTSGGVSIARIEFEVSTTLQLDGVNAVVLDGALAGARIGECTATVTVALIHRGPLAQRSLTLPVWRIIDLSRPIPLLAAAGTGTVR